MAGNAVKTFVKEFDFDVLGGGIPEGSVVLLRGPAGTMKSSLAYYILHHNAAHGRRGVYITFEQTATSLLEHMASLGFEPTGGENGLPILDLSRGREHLEGLLSRMAELRPSAMPRSEALVGILKDKILDLQKRIGVKILAIDSWDAMAGILELRDRRGESFSFFQWLRATGLTSFLISEVHPPTWEEGFEEEFLADGVLRLTMERTNDIAFQRRIQCVKLRSADHRAEPYILIFENGRFEVAKAIG